MRSLRGYIREKRLQLIDPSDAADMKNLFLTNMLYLCNVSRMYTTEYVTTRAACEIYSLHKSYSTYMKDVLVTAHNFNDIEVTIEYRKNLVSQVIRQKKYLSAHVINDTLTLIELMKIFKTRQSAREK